MDLLVMVLKFKLETYVELLWGVKLRQIHKQTPIGIFFTMS